VRFKQVAKKAGDDPVATFAWEFVIATRKHKDGVHFFTLNSECHIRYNKLLRNSKNGDIA